MNGRTARALARQRPLARAAWRVVETAGGRWPKRTAALRCWPGPPGGLFLTVPGRRCDRPAGRGRGADDGDGKGRNGSTPDRPGRIQARPARSGSRAGHGPASLARAGGRKGRKKGWAMGGHQLPLRPLLMEIPRSPVRPGHRSEPARPWGWPSRAAVWSLPAVAAAAALRPGPAGGRGP